MPDLEFIGISHNSIITTKAPLGEKIGVLTNAAYITIYPTDFQPEPAINVTWLRNTEEVIAQSASELSWGDEYPIPENAYYVILNPSVITGSGGVTLPRRGIN